MEALRPPTLSSTCSTASCPAPSGSTTSRLASPNPPTGLPACKVNSGRVPDSMGSPSNPTGVDSVTASVSSVPEAPGSTCRIWTAAPAASSRMARIDTAMPFAPDVKPRLMGPAENMIAMTTGIQYPRNAETTAASPANTANPGPRPGCPRWAAFFAAGPLAARLLGTAGVGSTPGVACCGAGGGTGAWPALGAWPGCGVGADDGACVGGCARRRSSASFAEPCE